MKFVRGKRQFKQEQLWGFVLITEALAGVRSFGLVIGNRMWGFQWKIPRQKRSSVAFVRSSRRSPPPTENKSSNP